MIHEIFVEWASLQILFALDLLPLLIILDHVWNEVPSENIINDDIVSPHLVLNEIVDKDDLDDVLGLRFQDFRKQRLHLVWFSHDYLYFINDKICFNAPYKFFYSFLIESIHV